VEFYYSRNENGVPHLVLECTKFLYERGLREMGIFRISSNYEKLQNYLKLFQSNGNVELMCENIDCHLAAGLLKAYFRTLPYSLFPPEHYPSLLLVTKIDSEEEQVSVTKELLKSHVNPEDFNTLIHVFHLLHAIASRHEENLMSPRNIGICWSPTLFHQGNEAEDLIIMMIEQHETIFGKLDVNTMTKVNVSQHKPIVKKNYQRRNSTSYIESGKKKKIGFNLQR